MLPVRCRLDQMPGAPKPRRIPPAGPRRAGAGSGRGDPLRAAAGSPLHPTLSTRRDRV